MAYYVYIVRCKDQSYYTGITWNLKKRILEHNKGVNISTKSKIPVKLVYWERQNDRISAARREREIKGWRREKKEILINSLH